MSKLKKYWWVIVLAAVAVFVAIIFVIGSSKGNSLAREYYEEAKALYQDRSYSAASDKLTEASKFTVDNDLLYNIHSLHGDIYANKGLCADALNQYQLAMAAKSSQLDGYLRAGEMALDCDRFDTAGEIYAKAAKLDPESLAAVIGGARAAGSAGRCDEAQQMLEAVKDQATADAELSYYYALLIAPDDTTNAEKYVKQALQLSDDGDLTARAEKFQEQLAEIERHPKNMAYRHLLLGWVYNEVDEPELALQSLQQALSLEPSYRDAFAFQAQSYILQKEYSEARTSLSKALEIDPNYGLALYLQGKVEMAEDLPEAAAVSFTQAEENGLLPADLYLSWGQALEEIQDYNEAREVYVAGLEEYPAEYSLHNALFWLEQEGLKDYDSATVAAESMSKLKDYQADAAASEALAALEQGKDNLAESLIQEALNYDKHNARAYYAWGILEKGNGDEDQAREYFLQAVDYDAVGDIGERAVSELTS